MLNADLSKASHSQKREKKPVATPPGRSLQGLTQAVFFCFFYGGTAPGLGAPPGLIRNKVSLEVQLVPSKEVIGPEGTKTMGITPQIKICF